jgi:hypothetical protein
LLVRLAFAARTYRNGYLAVKAPEKIEQLVCAEAAEVPVHQVRYVRLGDSQNAGNLPLSKLSFLENAENVESDLRASEEFIGIFQTEIGEDVPRSNLGFS